MAQPMIDCLNKLRNNRINCYNNRDIQCLQYLSMNHPNPNVRNHAIITLANCRGGWGSKKNENHVKIENRVKVRNHAKQNAKKEKVEKEPKDADVEADSVEEAL